MHTYTLHELNTYIRQVVALNFEDAVWITCEISQVRESRGQLYIELIQQNEEQTEIVATSAAVLWYKNHLFIRKKLGDLYDAIMADGTQVSIKIQVTYHERYGLKLNVLDIDPSYTIGQLEMQRQKIIERLRKEGVLHLNEGLPLPRVLQRIAVISSEQAAGYKDFVHQLDHNAYGYAYQYTLYQVAVQGVNVETEVCHALDQIAAGADQYDCAVIIRGGGSKLDLAGFDNFNIGYKIATSPLPVLTGIGHEIDNAVADIVAHTALKTPTAVADMLIEHNMQFDGSLSEMGIRLQQVATQVLQRYRYQLDQSMSNFLQRSTSLISRTDNILDAELQAIDLSTQARLRQVDQALDHHRSLMQVVDPVNTLRRGYAIVRQGGKAVSSIAEIDNEAALQVELQDGVVDR